jgi:hypothetical protein
MPDNRIITLNLPVETKALAKDISGALEVLLELAEADGTFRRALCGKDPDDNIETVELDLSHILRTRPFEPFKQSVVTELDDTWQTVAENTDNGTMKVVDIEIWKYTTDAYLTGVDVQLTDDVAATHQLASDMIVMAQAPPIKLGPYHLGYNWSVELRAGAALYCKALATSKQYGVDTP